MQCLITTQKNREGELKEGDERDRRQKDTEVMVELEVNTSYWSIT